MARRAPWMVKVAHFGYKRLQPKFTVGVAGVIFNDAGHVLLAEHVFHPQYPWGLPGGWINNAEQPHEAVLREIHEELGMTAAIHTLLLGEITLPKHLDFAYLCTTTEPVGRLSNELLDYGWFDPLNTPPLLIFHRRALDRAVEIHKLL